MKNIFVPTQSRLARGFTLIELLIVVAIIAILAAIAVPNFLEAQTRSKVSRTLADIRIMRIGIESYFIDNNRYPETDHGVNFLATQQAKGEVYSIYRLTTPISYMSTAPASPWTENYGSESGNPKIAQSVRSYLFVNKRASLSAGNPTVGGAPYDEFDQDYRFDRHAYLYNGAISGPKAPSVGNLYQGEWLVKSSGPDNLDDRDSTPPDGLGPLARLYNPTNGTISRGDIAIFNDVTDLTSK